MSHTPLSIERPGFSLVEVIVAILLLTTALLALEGSAAIAVRELADSRRESLAMRFAEGRRERSFGASCAASSGMDSANGVSATWIASAAASQSRLAQRTAFDTRYGVRSQAYDAIGQCR